MNSGFCRTGEMCLFSRLGRLFVAMLLVACLPLAVHASPLTFLGSFPTPFEPEGIAFDPGSGNLFLSSTGTDIDNTSTIYQFTTAGVPVGLPFVVPLNAVEGLHTLPNGNLLLTDPTRLYEFNTTTQVLTFLFGINPPSDDPGGATFHTGTGTYFVVDSGTGGDRIYEFNTSGNLINSINTTAINPNFFEPAGIDFDPVTQNLFIVNTRNDPNRSFYELTTSGTLVQPPTNLEALTGNLSDAAGAAYDPLTRTLYVAFSEDEEVDWGVGKFAVGVIPEPSTVLLLGSGLAGLVAAWWRRKQA